MQQETAEEGKVRRPGIYSQLKDKECRLVTFNYTSYARQNSSTALYFHGSLMEYVDLENKNDFFLDKLAAEISFDADHKTLPIPSFLPPLKLQPVISKRYIDTWYHTSQLMFRANKILILGCSFMVADRYFCDILRENSDAQIVIIDKDMETVMSATSFSCLPTAIPGSWQTERNCVSTTTG